jgi:hypothetical protein
VIAEYDNGAAPTAPSREYIYNGAGGSTTGLLAMISGSATTYCHRDHLSARLMSSARGEIAGWLARRSAVVRDKNLLRIRTTRIYLDRDL